MARYYTVEQLGPKRELTPEGFLLCRDVPVGRVGTQTYLEEETGTTGKNGIVVVSRSNDQVFDPKALASFEGKPITVTHPDDTDGVTPNNFKQLCAGFMQNLRKGTGIEDDLVLADLLVMDATAIEAINSRQFREVSLGYDVDYIEDAPGYAHQENIIGNHVALVERGRAGSRCSIKDEETVAMAKRTVWDRIMTAFKARDEEALKEAMEEGKSATDEDTEEKEDKVSKAIDALNKRLDALDAALKAKDEDAEEKEEKTEDEDESDPEDMTADMILTAETAGKIDCGKLYTGDDYKNVLSRVETLAPGLKAKTNDAAKSYGHLLKLQIKALDTAMQSDNGLASVTPFLHGKTLDSLTAREIKNVFLGASELMAARNNAAGSRSSMNAKDSGHKPKSISEINAANAAFWSSNKG